MATEDKPQAETVGIHCPLRVETAYGQWFIVDFENRVIAMTTQRWYAAVLASEYNSRKEAEQRRRIVERTEAT